MKIISWNVNGIRAIINKRDFFSKFQEIDADVFCIQETKAQDNQVQEVLSEELKDYYIYSNSAVKKGYAGTAIISKIEPISVKKNIGIDIHDDQGRVLCLEFDDFFLVNVYVPNSGQELKRLSYREDWDLAFYNYLKKLEETKPIIVCGDMNVAHKEIDIARPKANYNKSAGYTQIEIDGMDRFINGDLLDSFRLFHPNEKDQYSWWSMRGGARSRNVGWRLDYFLVSKSLKDKLQDAFIMQEVMGSDHCPVGIIL
ncbi:MAG: exodeoxyribonuclease III [Bacteroidales bacterium]